MRRNGAANRGRGRTGRRDEPMFRCPAGCNHEVLWGSMANCENFIKHDVDERRKLVEKKCTCPVCLKDIKRVKHKPAECKWRDCDNCGERHHGLICKKPRMKQVTFKTTNDDDSRGKGWVLGH